MGALKRQSIYDLRTKLWREKDRKMEAKNEIAGPHTCVLTGVKNAFAKFHGQCIKD
jgi:hypothetical protein